MLPDTLKASKSAAIGNLSLRIKHNSFSLVLGRFRIRVEYSGLLLNSPNLGRRPCILHLRNERDDLDEENHSQSLTFPLDGDVEPLGRSHGSHTLLVGKKGSSHPSWARQGLLGGPTLDRRSRFDLHTSFACGREQTCDTNVCKNDAGKSLSESWRCEQSVREAS